MEKTGLIDSLSAMLNNVYLSRNEKDRSRYTKLTTSIVKQINATKNVYDIINAEQTILRHNLQYYAPDVEFAVNSTSSAITEVDNAFKALKILTDTKNYKLLYDGMSTQARDRVDGMPRDAFLTFVMSNRTRLMNYLKNPNMDIETKYLLSARYDYMTTAKNEYISMQKLKMGIKVKSKEKGIER